jgi:CBS domain containing-hemolysin-like protein
MDISLTLLVMLICLIAEAFFSGSEIGIVSADRIKLRHAAAKGSRGAKLALEMLEKPEWLLSTTLVGTNIAVVTNTTMATALMIDLFGPGSSWLAVVIAAPLIWVFGEIVPKSVFQQRADVITPRAIFILKGCSFIFYPILMVFSSLARLLSRMVGAGSTSASPFTLREEILSMMQMPGEEVDIEPMEQTMIRRLFNFGETTAREVMMPLIDVVAIDQQATCAQAMQLATDKAHSVMPVYADRIDRIVGILDTLELLGLDPGLPIQPYIKPVTYVPGSKGIQDLLLDLRQARAQVSVVVDEFGGAEGIVSIEDILEEVVEDIQDEYDTHEKVTEWVRKLDDREYIVAARMPLDDLADELGIELPKETYASLSGFLLDKAQEVPQVGDSIKYRSITFTVHRGTPRAIKEVRIIW